MAISILERTQKRRGVTADGVLRLFVGLCLASVFVWTFWASKHAPRVDGPSADGSEIPFSSHLEPTSIKHVASTPVRRWAYAFLVGGVLDPLTDYRGFLFGVVVAAKTLRDAGSQADVVILIQLSYNTNSTRLPQDEEALLTSVGVKIKYLPKFAGRVHEQFYGLMMEKFRILELTEYTRVLYLDTDIMPLCNLDYMFELSDPSVPQLESEPSPLLKENVILGWRKEPCHGGFFMLSPGPGKFNEIEQVIRRREEEALNMTFPYWDKEIGWGHRFNNVTDYWRSEDGTKGALWDWWGSFADQGLIYYWVKYHEKSASIILGHEVESWGSDENGVLTLERVMTGGPLNNFSCIPRPRRNSYFRASPNRDYIHFTGRKKPWDKNYTWLEEKITSEPYSTEARWFTTLISVAKEISFNISRSIFGAKKYVGGFPEINTMYRHIVAKKERGWSPYQENEDR